MAQKTGFFARLFSSGNSKKELCCGIQLEEIGDTPSAPTTPAAKTSTSPAQASGEGDIKRPAGS